MTSKEVVVEIFRISTLKLDEEELGKMSEEELENLICEIANLIKGRYPMLNF